MLIPAVVGAILLDDVPSRGHEDHLRALEEVGRPGPWAQTRPLTVGELDLEGPGPGEVLVQMEAAGVCHSSDLSVVDGN